MLKNKVLKLIKILHPNYIYFRSYRREASNVVVKSKGDLVILIMADTEMTTSEEAIAPKLEANFDNL